MLNSVVYFQTFTSVQNHISGIFHYMLKFCFRWSCCSILLLVDPFNHIKHSSGRVCSSWLSRLALWRDCVTISICRSLHVHKCFCLCSQTKTKIWHKKSDQKKKMNVQKRTFSHYYPSGHSSPLLKLMDTWSTFLLLSFLSLPWQQ